MAGGKLLLGLYSLLTLLDLGALEELVCYESTQCGGQTVEMENNLRGDCCDGRGLSFSLAGSCKNCFSIEEFCSDGSEFYVAFFSNLELPYFFSIISPPQTSLMINNVETTTQTVSVRYNSGEGNVTIEAGSSNVVSLPASVRFGDSRETENGVLIQSTDRGRLSISAFVSDYSSSDTYQVLPCVHLPAMYEYYAMSVERDNQVVVEFGMPTLPDPLGNSVLVFIASENGTRVTLTPSRNIQLRSQDMVMAGTSIKLALSRGEAVFLESMEDLSGTHVVSNKPLAFFSGHECGNMPSNQSFCDHMVEQLPPTSTWGREFYTGSFITGSFVTRYRAISSRNSTSLNWICTGREGESFNMIDIPAAGQVVEFQIPINQFCRFTSTLPVLLVEFTVGAVNTTTTDPSMALVPPVGQYKHSYVLSYFTGQKNFVNILLPNVLQIDSNGVRLNGGPINGTWTDIPCDNDTTTICAYGIQVELDDNTVGDGSVTLSHVNPEALLLGMPYSTNYRTARSSFSGMTQKPIALDIISLSEAEYTTEESEAEVIITIIRSGLLMDNLTVLFVATDIPSSPNTAIAGEDFTEVRREVRLPAGETQVTVAITLGPDDVFPGMDKMFQVYLGPAPGAFIYPTVQANVIIADLDLTLPLMNISFIQTSYTINESRGILEIVLTKSEGARGPVTVTFTPFSETALSGVDFQLEEVNITFQVSETRKVVPVIIINDDVMETAVEEFRIIITPVAGVFPLAVVDNVTRVEITDDDIGALEELVCYESTQCGGQTVEMENNLRGDCCDGRGLSFSLAGSCKNCFSMEEFCKDGSEFYVAFFSNLELPYFISAFSPPQTSLVINNVETTTQTVSVRYNSGEGNVTIEAGSSNVVSLPASVRFGDSRETENGVLIQSTDGGRLSMSAFVSDYSSSDTYQVLPCVHLPALYEYYAMSVERDNQVVVEFGMIFPDPPGNSVLVFIASENDTRVTLTPSQNVQLRSQDMVMAGTSIKLALSRGEAVFLESMEDLSGTHVVSNKPLAFFSGHECGNMPSNQSFCDHMVEQLPPTSTWGREFYTGSFITGSFVTRYRAISSRNSTSLNWICTGREGESFNMIDIPAAGLVVEFQIPINQFCRFTSTLPVLLVEFTVGAVNTTTTDPSMALVPPVGQYKHSYVLSYFTGQKNFVNILLPNVLQIDSNGVRLNGGPINGTWTDIPCDNDTTTICAYGIQVELDDNTVGDGSVTLSHVNPEALLLGMPYSTNYRTARSSFSGMTQKPIALDTISLSEAEYTTEESEAEVIITIIRSGLLMDNLTVLFMATDIPSSPNTATAGEDFTEVRKEVRLPAGETQVTVAITLDIFAKVFQVYLGPAPGAFIYPTVQANVIIADLDLTLPLMNISFIQTSYTINESRGILEIVLTKSEGARGPVTVTLTPFSETALSGVDFQLEEVNITFQVSETRKVVPVIIINDNVMETAVEEFRIIITPVAGVFPLAVVDNVTRVKITDDDIGALEELVCYESTQCGGQTVEMENNLRGDCCDGRGLSFSLAGSCKNCFSMEEFCSDGSEFYVAFFSNLELPSYFSRFSPPQTSLMINNVETTTQTVSVRYNSGEKNFRIEAGSSNVLSLPASVRFGDSRETENGLLIQSTDGGRLSMSAFVSDYSSSDTYQVLPCVHLPAMYEYYAMSVERDNQVVVEFGMIFPDPPGNSVLVFIASENGTRVTLTPSQNVQLRSQDMVMAGTSIKLALSRGEAVFLESMEDLSGTHVVSNKPLAFFSGHECGNMPSNQSFCDHMVEQLPPTSTWGREFYTGSFITGSFVTRYRAISSRNSTSLNWICTGREGESFNMIDIPAAGKVVEFQIAINQFCRFTSTLPVLLAEFTVGAVNTTTTDPSMALVPPVGQYKHSYVLSYFTGQKNFVNILLPNALEIDSNGVRLNGGPINGTWTDIPCDNDTTTICAYGIQVELDDNTVGDGSVTLSHVNPEALLLGMPYSTDIGTGRSSCAGMTQKPIALDTISLSKAEYTTEESEAEVIITIIRSGLLMDNLTVLFVATDIPSSPNTAIAGEDFTEVRREVRLPAGETQVTVAITLGPDDVFPGTDKVFQVYLGPAPGAFIYPTVQANVIIADLDLTLPLMNISFIQTSYTINESRGILEIVVTKSKGARGPVTVTLTPFSETALSGVDFQLEEVNITFQVSETRKVVPVIIINDDVMETAVEEFRIIITPVAGVFPLAVVDNVTRVEITDDDSSPCSIGFSSSAYTVSESQRMVEVCVGMTCPSSSKNTVTVDVYSTESGITSPHANKSYPNFACEYNPQDYEDYYGQLRGCNSMQQLLIFEDSTVCSSITIIDDERLEQTEYTGLFLYIKSMTAETRVTRQNTKIKIDDDDMASIGFVGEVNVIEGENAEVCVEVKSPSIECPIKKSFQVRIDTSDDTAVAGSTRDYLSYNRVIVFDECARVKCVNITTVARDCEIERLEQFTVILQKYGSGVIDRIQFDVDEISIFITDNETAIVTLEDADRRLKMEERLGPAQVVMTIRDANNLMNLCFSGFSFLIAFTTLRGTAFDNEDFEKIGERIQFDANTKMKTVDVGITDDKTVEFLKEEYFFVQLSTWGGQPTSITVDRRRLNITIIDDDTATFGLEKPTCTVIEGNVFSVCVVQKPTIYADCPVKFDFPLTLTVMGEQTTSTDHNAMSTMLECQRKVCKNITIIGDMSLESDETFTISLEKPPDHDDRIKLSLTSKDITVYDNDTVIIEFEKSAVVSEGDTLSVCLSITACRGSSCPSSVDVYLRFTTRDGTARAGSDYRRVFKTITIPACARRYCEDIEIINSTRLEKDETFSVSIIMTSTNRNIHDGIIIPLGEKEFTIYEDSYVDVEFDMTYISVDEGSNFLVCVEVIPEETTSCPVDFEFIIILNLSPQTAMPDDYCNKTEYEMSIPRCDERKCTLIEICDDCNLEDFETFTIDMEHGPGVVRRVRIDEDDVTVNITDNDILYVNQELEIIRIMEDDGTAKVCFFISDINGEATCSNSKLFLINVTTFDDSTDIPTDDYVPINDTQVFFQPYISRNCTNITIINDLTVEKDELFKVNITSDYKFHSHVNASGITEVFIVNDDSAVVGLERTTYSVLENETLTICLSVSSPIVECPIAFPFDVDLNLNPGTAVFPSDYTLASRNDNNRLRFEACANTSCLDILLEDDLYIEDTEYFTITLAPSDDSFSIFIKLNPKIATVTIEDDDKAVVGFDDTVYSTSEGAVLTICLRVFTPSVPCPVRTPFNMTLYDVERNATYPEDYTTTAELITVQFSRCARLSCASRVVTITQDREVEKLEYFRLVAESVDYSLTKAEPSRSTVYIRDTDYATVQLTQTSFTATEAIDSFVTICAEITYPPITDSDCPVTFEFTLKLSVREDEYDVRFAACQREPCVNANIVNDNRLEKTETYAIRLSRPADVDSRIRLSRSTGRLTVYEDQTETAHIDLIVTGSNTKREEDGYVEVCAEIVSPTVTNPVAFSFSVIIRTADGTAKRSSDYTYLSRTLYFSVGERKECVNVTIRNDHTQELDEYFDVNLLRPSNLPNTITFTTSTQRITIIDADPAEVGLEKASYSVREDGGLVEVCVTISTQRSTNCPVAYNFSVNVVYLAGTASREDDFRDSGTSSTLGIPACTRRKCFNVNIVDNHQLEGTESFEVVLFRNALTDDIVFNRDRATITITDEDKAQVEFTQATYSVEESRSRTVCVKVISQNGCIIPLPFFVNITSSLLRSTSNSNVAKPALQNDFFAVNVEVRFPICTPQMCIPINTINDEDVEGTEVFRLSLRYPDGQNDGVSIGPIKTTDIYIEDDDTARLNVQFPQYPVNEGNGSVYICAAVRSPFPASDGCPLNFRFRVRLVMTALTADGSDYSDSSQTIYFSRCQEVSCTSIAITDDRIMEELNENFEISLESMNTPSVVRVSSQPSYIKIFDNDMLTIGFDRTAYTVRESSRSMRLCASIKQNGRSAINNTIRISTSPDTATTGSPSDFSTISTLLVFEPGTSRICVNVAINNDDTVEEREKFNAELLRPSSLDDRVVLEPRSASVFITDNDYAYVSLVRVSQKAGEGATVTVVINTGDYNCPVGFEFNVTFTASRSGTADESDYSFPEQVTIPACRNGTLTVRILNDEVVERDETVIIIGSISNSRIRYAGRLFSITITDNNVARVGLQHSYLEVAENVGTVSICAFAKNEDGRRMKIDIAYDVEFIFTPDSASNPYDFTTSRAVGRYNLNTNQSCGNLNIVNSYSVEMPESLFVSIRLLDDDISSITIDPHSQNGTIAIVDDDAATIGLKDKYNYLYRRYRGATSLEICLYISRPTRRRTYDCPIAFPFNIIFRLSNTTGGAFEVDADQEPEDEDRIRNRGRDTILLFNSCQREFCFIVNQINGTTVNYGERFSISVARTPDHGLNILLDESLKTGFIEIR